MARKGRGSNRRRDARATRRMGRGGKQAGDLLCRSHRNFQTFDVSRLNPIHRRQIRSAPKMRGRVGSSRQVVS